MQLYNGLVSTIEQAFLMANSGRYASIDEIRRELNRLRYPGVDTHLAGRSIKAQLSAAIKAARA